MEDIDTTRLELDVADQMDLRALDKELMQMRQETRRARRCVHHQWGNPSMFGTIKCKGCTLKIRTNLRKDNL